MTGTKNDLLLTHWCMIRSKEIRIDDKVDHYTENFSNFAAFLKEVYKKEKPDYPKFYKMDLLSKLAFLTAEKLFKEGDVLTRYPKDEFGILIFNSSSSLDTDMEYQKTIQDKSAYFPSPSVFVYTLPNILIGEVCIRHQIKGENAFMVSEKFNPDLIHEQVTCLMESNKVRVCLAGWVEVNQDYSESLLFIVEKKSSMTGETRKEISPRTFTSKNLTDIYHINGE